MTTQDLNLVQAMVQRMNWMEQRQKVIAQNIANADTPNYQPQDLVKQDFRGLLGSSTSSASLTGVQLASTNSQHVGGSASPSDATYDPKNQRKAYEVAPAGNAVVLEEQLLKMNENMTDHRFISNLYQKNIAMLKSTLK